MGVGSNGSPLTYRGISITSPIDWGRLKNEVDRDEGPFTGGSYSCPARRLATDSNDGFSAASYTTSSCTSDPGRGGLVRQSAELNRGKNLTHLRLPSPAGRP